jgi:hypothetical protein
MKLRVAAREASASGVRRRRNLVRARFGRMRYQKGTGLEQLETDVFTLAFNRHIAAELGVSGPVDDSHSTCAELLEDRVMGKGLPNHET